MAILLCCNNISLSLISFIHSSLYLLIPHPNLAPPLFLFLGVPAILLSFSVSFCFVIFLYLFTIYTLFLLGYHLELFSTFFFFNTWKNFFKIFKYLKCWNGRHLGSWWKRNLKYLSLWSKRAFWIKEILNILFILS